MYCSTLLDCVDSIDLKRGIHLLFGDLKKTEWAGIGFSIIYNQQNISQIALFTSQVMAWLLHPTPYSKTGVGNKASSQHCRHSYITAKTKLLFTYLVTTFGWLSFPC